MSLRQRAAVAAAVMAAAGGAAIATAPPSSAHACVQVRANGLVVGSCHVPPVIDHFCLATNPDFDLVVTTVGATVCVPSPGT